LSDAPLLRIGEKSIVRSPFVWGAETPRIKNQGVRQPGSATQGSQSLPDDSRAENSPGVEKVAKPTTVCGAERGKPVGVSAAGSRKIAQERVEREQSPTTPLRVKDGGASESRPVTGRTGSEHKPLCKKCLCDMLPVERQPTSARCIPARELVEDMVKKNL